jgi:hypothetical protein
MRKIDLKKKEKKKMGSKKIFFGVKKKIFLRSKKSFFTVKRNFFYGQWLIETMVKCP